MYVNHSEGKPRISGKNTLGDSYGKRTLPYQNTIGERKPSIWAGLPELNFHRYDCGWPPVSYGILVGGYASTIGERLLRMVGAFAANVERGTHIVSSLSEGVKCW